MARLRSRQGMALPIAIGSIVLIGTLIAGVFFTVTQESRVGKATSLQEQVFRNAEALLGYTVAKWNNSAMTALAIGATKTVGYDSSAVGWVDTVRITRLNQSLYMVTSAATSSLGAGIGAQRSAGELIKLTFPRMNFLGALTVRGALQVGGASNINGVDQSPPGWGCPPVNDTLPAVATNAGSNVSFSGCNNMSCLTGSPKIDTTLAAADSSTYFSFGDSNWQSLVSVADINFPTGATYNGIGPVVSNGVCSKANTLNWGDPNRANPAGPCESYFPIIHFGDSTSAVKLTGGTGQGILLVDGDLEVSGGFTFYGPVIVRGHLRTTGTGGHFNGGVMAANVDLEQNAVLGNAIINYSSCAIQNAVIGAGGPMPSKDRPWVETF